MADQRVYARTFSQTLTLVAGPMIELPGVIESGMPGRNGQRKPGTTRGSPRRSRTAKAFTKDAVVKDEGHTYTGVMAISNGRPKARPNTLIPANRLPWSSVAGQRSSQAG
jgi:hypothetical protein